MRDPQKRYDVEEYDEPSFLMDLFRGVVLALLSCSVILMAGVFALAFLEWLK